jgi:GTP-binding protein YchF
MQIGIVGLPFSGKTTFFQTLTETHLDPSALQKRDANLATIKIPDKRLDEFTEIFNPKKKVNATVEIIDLVGLQKGDRATSGFTNTFLGKVKTNDALLHVVRGFNDEALPHVEGSIDLMRDIKTLEEEFIFADMAFCEARIEKLTADLKKPKAHDAAVKELELINRWNENLSNGIPLRDLDFSEEEERMIKNYQPLTVKPLLIALNLEEKDIPNADQIVEKIKSQITGKNIEVEPFFAKIELELSQLGDEEKEMFNQEYGITDSALARLIRSAFQLLGLQSFFTVGEDECRAWTINKGMNAQESAGVIHSDFFAKFIRAEVVSYIDFMKYGTFPKCKEHGVFRLEGKEYVVKDGDILHVRHG